MASTTTIVEPPVIELVSISGPEPGSVSTHPAQRPPKSAAFKAAFISLCACSFASLLDTVIIAAALPAIARDLNASSNNAYWCGTGFLFAQAISQPVYGSLSNTFGRKPCIMFGLTLFIIASIFCATAQSITWLIVARVFQGLGAGGNNAMVSVIITDMVALNERAKYQGLLSIGGAIASVSGSVIGAAIASTGKSNWRIIFWINLPICVPALLGIFFFIHLHLAPQSLRNRLTQLDWIGIVVSTGSVAGLLYGITSGSVLYPWESPQILSAIIIGAAGTAIFFLYEAKLSSHPMIPVRIFGNRTSNGAYLASFVMGMVLWAMQYNLILYFLVSRRKPLLGAAVSMLPGTLSLALSSIIAAIIVSKTQRFKYLNSVGWALMTLGFGLMATLTSSSSAAKQYGSQFIYGLGGGVVFLCRIFATQASQSDEDVAMATALISYITSLGQAFGVGIGGLIFETEWDNIVGAVSANLLPKQYVLSSKEIEQAYILIEAFPPDVQSLYREIMARVIDKLFIVLASLSGFALLVSLIARNLSMEKESRSTQAFAERGRRLGRGTAQRPDERPALRADVPA